eukprot:g6474.t1
MAQTRACGAVACRCPEGEYEAHPKVGNQARICLPHKSCKPGEFESAEPTWLDDRECEPCPEGHGCSGDGSKKVCDPDTFAAGGADACKPCQVVDAVRRYWTKNLPGQSQCWKKPVNCVLEPLDQWTACSKTCGGGIRTRAWRSKVLLPCALSDPAKCSQAWGGGEVCAQKADDVQQCGGDSCPVDCQLSEWSAWDSKCSESCGGGVVARTRTELVSAAHGGEACGDLREEKPCNEHSCSYKPACDAAHVHCAVKKVQLGTITERVMRMTHHRKFMHVGANYHCKMNAARTQCGCSCDKQPPCCIAKNVILKNPVLPGNRYSGVESTQACCNLCYHHPQCTSWEMVEGTVSASERNVCVLKQGTPKYERSLVFGTTTWVGTTSRVSVRPGQSNCEAPVFMERDVSLGGSAPGPNDQGGDATVGPAESPYAGIPLDKVEIPQHQMTGEALNGMQGNKWVENLGSLRGQVDVRNMPQGQD